MCKKSLLMMLLCFAFFGLARAQVTIGDLETAGNDTYLPMNSLYEYSYSQQIYTADEIGTAGTINAITIWMYGAANLYTIPFDIYMVETDKESFTSTTDWESVTSGDIVYSGSVTVHNTTAEAYTFELATPFSYSGTGNLLIAFDNNCGQWRSGLTGKVFTATDNVTRSIYARRDSNDYDPTDMSGVTASAAPRAMRNVIEIDITPSGSGPTCARPTGLAISYTGGNTAQVSWNSEATAWNIDVNGTVTAITTNPYTLTGLEMGTNYTVKVQANCGGGDLSDWSAAKSFTTDLCMPENMCEISYQLNDSYGDGWNGNAINVTDVLTGNTITQLTMTSGSSASGSFAVCDGRQIQFSWVTGSYAYETSYTVTDANGTVIFSGSDALTEPVNYTVDCPSCITPKNFTVSDITAHGATLDWVSAAEAWQIDCNGEITDVTEKPYALRLEPDTEYTVKVRAYCGGEDYSEWTSAVTFSTLPTCYAPTDMVISDITAYTANVAWTSNNTNIEMRYSPDVRPITTFDDSQMHGWTNIDADGDGYVWVLASEAAGVYHSAGVDVTGQGHNGSHDFILSGSWTNAAGTALTPDNYLVSPQITLGGSISFWAQAQDATYAAEHFGVAVSTTGNTDAADFTTIQEWTMTAKSANPFRTNAPRGGNNLRAGNWYQYTVDLSAYSGQGYVAIRHFDCTDQFILNVDDIFIEEPGFELPWVYVTNPASPQALTNLEPETTYLVQVRANCGAEDGYSQWLEGSFTTLPACMVPTNLVISNIDKRSADLTWTPNGEETAWQICVNGDENNLIDVTETTYSFTGLEPETLYSVKVRAYCDEQLQSAWSSPVTFYTLIACPAPTNLAISDITNVSAVASWTGEGDFELQYAEDVWKHYDNGVYATSMGAGGTIYWGMMLPAESLTAGEPLTKVALHTSYAGEATLNVYLGGDQPTGTPAATQTFTMAGDGDFMEITLDTPVAIDGTQNLWITFYQSGLTYPADGCTGPTDPNGRWVSLNGEEWADIAGYGYDYTWMIRAAFGNASTEWVTVDNATSPQAITGLTPETNYFVRVKHICGGIDGESVWTSTSFTTDVACPAPEALAATPYALSAELSWEGISESYTVRYGIVEVGEILSSFDFEDETIPADFTNSTSYPWTVTEGGADGSGYCVIPGNAGVNSSSSDLTLQVTGPCAVSFMAKVSSENNYDWGRFLIDGTQQMQICGTKDWESYSYTVAAGTHTLVWRYYKDVSSASGNDLFYVDNIVINEMSYAWETTTATTNECTITGLTPMTTYYAQVMGDCGDFGTSEWSEMISFTTTEDACPVPTNLTVDTETLTATTADLSWNGSPDVESFTVRYRAPQHATEGSLYETFGTTIPTGWTMYTGLLSTVMEDPTALTANTYAWSFGTNNGVFDNHARVNIYGTYQRWLVTPEVTVAAGANLAFDMALTVWSSSSSASPTAGGQPDDKFIVLISTDSLQTWTVLREWNNSGSEYVYDEITNDANGQAVSIDLSAYAGQTVHIAFYGESTESNGDNNLHIDNVIIGEVIPATDWQTVTTTETNVTLTGLTPETTYEAQVKADCSDPEAWTNLVNFTTLEQTTVTQTIALTAGANWISTYVEITLADLQAALVEALGSNATGTVIKDKNSNTRYTGSTWRGGLTTMDVALMYMITVSVDCEITLEGMPINPEDHPITISNGANWIGFPFSQSMTLNNAFAGFAISNDVIKNKDANSRYTGSMWRGSFTTLEPGKGYIYNSNSTTQRTLVYPTSAK